MLDRLFRYAKPYIGRLVLVNILAPLSSLIFVSYFIIFKSLIDGGIIAKDIGTIKRDLILLVGLAVVRESISYASNWLRTALQEQTHMDVQMDLFSRILRLPMGVIAKMPAGELINKVIAESAAIPALLTQWSVEALQEPVKIIGLSCVLFYFDRKLALFIIVIIVPVVLINKLIARRLASFYELFYEKKAGILTRLEEVLTALPVVKAFVKERDEERRFDGLLKSCLATDLGLAKVSLAASPLNEITKIAALAAVVLAGSYHVRDGSLNAGTLLLFIGSTVSLFTSLQSVTYLYTALQSGMVCARRVCALLDICDEEENLADADDTSAALQGTIALEDVSFSYTGREAVFDRIRLDLPDGAFIAVIGESGSGKTTLAYLLARFYRPSGGILTLNGVDASAGSVREWRRRIGIVLQDTIIFSGTIYDNIAYARPEAQAEEVYAAARAGDIHDFIMSLPDGYQTAVGERGVGLSGGQRQRVAIARALLIVPDLLILDEATSFVDVESEERILSAVKSLRKGKKTLMMTHRASSLKFADKVYKLERGDLSS
jgi:ABC-type multidrug transport system fused ATPase/permease subunit